MKSENVAGASPPLVLDPEQRQVIEAAPDGRLLVVAGPGTGKTQVAAMRLVHLIGAGLQPAHILVLSFSRSAVATLTKRVARLDVGEDGIVEDLRHLAVRTFDSWAFRLLRQHGATVTDLISNSHDENIRLATRAIADTSDQEIDERLAAVRHVIVDEFQDLPGVRSEMVIELLARLTSDPHRRVGFTVLGDPAQAIYKFAVRNGNAAADGPDPWDVLKARIGAGLREVSMLKNHRSTEELAANAASMRKILRSFDLDPPQKLAAMQRYLDRLPSTEPEMKIGPELLEKMPDGSVAVLTRTNGEAVMVAKMLLGDEVVGPAVPVRLRLSGTAPPAPAWIAQLLSRFKPSSMSRATFDIVYAKVEAALEGDLRDAINLPTRDIAWRRLARASGAPDSASAIAMDDLRERLGWPDSFPDDQSVDDAAVFITTIHQAKGMEFDNVALLEARAREDEEAPEDPLEEANVGFVAITRAGRHLGRIPATCIYKAPRTWSFQHGRARQVAWGRMVNVQLGLPGDVEATSSVDADVHGSVEAVEDLQKDLSANAAAWRGHKVILKRVDPVEDSSRYRDARYNIHLQQGREAGRLLGRTSSGVTMDLLQVVWKPGYSLPSLIYNLRIADVVTLASIGDTKDSIPEPWCSSRIWLGVSLWGTGDFKTWKRQGG